MIDVYVHTALFESPESTAGTVECHFCIDVSPQTFPKNLLLFDRIRRCRVTVQNNCLNQLVRIKPATPLRKIHYAAFGTVNTALSQLPSWFTCEILPSIGQHAANSIPPIFQKSAVARSSERVGL